MTLNIIIKTYEYLMYLKIKYVNTLNVLIIILFLSWLLNIIQFYVGQDDLKGFTWLFTKTCSFLN